MGIITRKIRLRFNDESYDEFIRLHDRRAKTCRATYNLAVCEYTENYRRAYVQNDGKQYMDKANHNPAKQVAKQAGVGYTLNPLVFRRDEFMFFDDLCTIICEVVHVRSKLSGLGYSQTARQPVRTQHNDWIKLFNAAAHNDISKQKPIITHSFSREAQYDQI